MNEDDFKFRVPVDDGTKRTIYFDNANDAKDFAQACYDATHIEMRGSDGKWKIWWQDGEMISMRDGFFVLVPYRGSAWNNAVQLMKEHNSKCK